MSQVVWDAVGPGSFIQAKYFFWANGQLAINSYHMRIIAKPVVAVTDQDLYERFYDWLVPHYLPLLNPEAVFIGIKLQGISPLNFVYVQQVPDEGGTATASDLQPGNVSGVITKRTGLVGRRRRGRVFVPFPGEVENDPVGFPVAGYLTTLQVLADQFGGAIAWTIGGDPDIQHIVLSSIAAPLPAYADVTSGFAQPRWGSMHSRGNYGALNPKVVS